MLAQNILDMTPAELFSGSPDDISSQFKRYAKDWHPDRNKDPKAIDVFQHIKRSMEVALGKSSDHRITLTRVDGSKFSMDYIRKHETSYGTIFVGRSSVAYLINRSFDSYALAASKREWPFLNGKVKNEMSRFLPTAIKAEETTSGWFLAYRRKGTQVLLRDLIDYQKGKPFDYRAVMWMISGMLNIASYLDIHRIGHNAINPDFLLLDLNDHAVTLTGPALFSVGFGKRPSIVPVKTLNLFPRLRVKEFKIENSLVDLTLVRALALQLLDKKNTPDLRMDDSIPAGLRSWLMSSPPSRAVSDYAAWETKRGKRAFHEFGVSARDVYRTLRE